MSILGKLRKVLTVLTDVLLIGRKQGWWSKKEVPHRSNNTARKKKQPLPRRR
jgi:hypothetical protein